MKIELLYFEGCPHRYEAETLVRDALADLGKEAHIELIAVPDDATALTLRFLGSPTIRIDGKDVEPDADTGQYGLRCRLYSTRTGVSGIPDKEMIRTILSESSS